MLRRILCSTDHSDAARRAMEAAIHVARVARAEIVALAVLPPPSCYDESARRAEPAALRALCTLAQEHGVEGRPLLAFGERVSVILREAQAGRTPVPGGVNADSGRAS
jgi:nucleotide-binding universal stress UspA family protein